MKASNQKMDEPGILVCGYVTLSYANMHSQLFNTFIVNSAKFASLEESEVREDEKYLYKSVITCDMVTADSICYR